MPATITDTTQNPIVLSSGQSTTPFAGINIQDPFYSTWDSVYGGGNGYLTISIKAQSGYSNSVYNTGTLSDPGAGGFTTPPLFFDSLANIYTEQSNGGPTIPSFLSPSDILHRLVYTAPTLPDGVTQTVTANISYSGDVDVSGGATYPTPTQHGTAIVYDPMPVKLQASGAATNQAPRTIGSGSDAIVLHMSEDEAGGDAQFTISVDGVQQGGIQTTTALHSAGTTQHFTVKGDFGAGDHKISVSFLNDLYARNLDRNLFVDGITYNGDTVPVSSSALFWNQTVDFVRPAAALPQHTLSLAMTEDAYLGDAQAEITVDGKSLGTLTVTALNPGPSQIFNFATQLAAGDHTVGIAFLNDAWGGSDATDRNLRIQGISLDGVNTGNAPVNLFNAGVAQFAIHT